MNEYQEQILDHYKNPRNFGMPDWKADFSIKSENISCGDEVQIFIKWNKEKVEKINFIGRGCSISIASASLLSEALVGKTKDEVLSYSEEELKQLLGIPLTTSRLVCATLPLDAIKKSLNK